MIVNNGASALQGFLGDGSASHLLLTDIRVPLFFSLPFSKTDLYFGRATLMHIYLLESIVDVFFIYSPKDKMFSRNAIIFLFAAWFVNLELWFTHHNAIIENIPKLIAYDDIFGLVFLIIAISFYIYTIINHAEARLEIEQKKSESLLLNVLPQPIAKRLKDGSGRIADHFEEATIFFSDIVNFTATVRTMSADRVISKG